MILYSHNNSIVTDIGVGEIFHGTVLNWHIVLVFITGEHIPQAARTNRSQLMQLASVSDWMTRAYCIALKTGLFIARFTASCEASFRVLGLCWRVRSFGLRYFNRTMAVVLL